MIRTTRLGISTFCYPYAVGVPGFAPQRPMTVCELVDRAADLHVPVLQIGDNLPLHLQPEDALERLSRRAAERGITLEIGTRGIQPEHLLRYLAIAGSLHAKLVRVVIDTPQDRPDFDEILRRLRAVLPQYEAQGVTLGIENHDRFPADTFARLMDGLHSDRTGIVLDTVNSFACEENTRQVLERLGPYTVNFHAKDFDIVRVPNAMGLLVTGTPAGKGRLHIPEILSELSRTARSDFTTVLELWMPPEPTVEQTIVKENCWVLQSVEYLEAVLRSHRQFLKKQEESS